MSEIQKQLLGTVIIILLVTAVYMTVKNIVTNTLLKKAKRKSDKKALTTITVTTNVLKYLLYIVAILMILDVWGVDTKALLTSLGVVGVIVGLALQDLLKDIIAGTAILTEDQFQVGDNIKIGDFRGDVISLGLKTTKIRAYSGEVKIIANRNITEVINYSLKASKSVVDVPTSYENDIDKVKSAIKTVCEKMQNEEYVTGEIEILGVEDLSDSSVNIRVVATTKPTYNYTFKRAFLEEIIREFRKQNLTIPYPQVEVHNEKWL